MTVRLDAAEKLVIGCTEHVGDGRLVDPAVAQPLAATQQPVKTCAVGGRAEQIRNKLQNTLCTKEIEGVQRFSHAKMSRTACCTYVSKLLVSLLEFVRGR